MIFESYFIRFYQTCSSDYVLHVLELKKHIGMVGAHINPLTARLSDLIFTHLKLCLADGIHNFKWAKKFLICWICGKVFLNHFDQSQILHSNVLFKVLKKGLKTIIIVIRG